MFGALEGDEGEDGDDDNASHNTELDEWPYGDAAYHGRVVVTDELETSWLVAVNLDVTTCCLHLLCASGELRDGVGTVGGLDADVTVVGDVAVLVDDDDRDIVIVFDDMEHQGEVGVLVCIVEGVECIRP